MLEIKPKKLKIHSLTGRIDSELMMASWKAVKRNKGAAGVDRITIPRYAKKAPSNLGILMKRLKTRGGYKSPPLKRVYIPKGNTGDLRPLGIPTVETRVAQEVIRCLLEPIYEKQFHENSFGFRPGRNCHQAVERVLKYTKSGYKHIVDVDIKGFFDNIPHNVIMTMLRAELADGNILDIIETFLGSGVVEDGALIPTTKGTPQGGVISPLLANITLNYLDWKLHQKGYKFVRYADDMVILCETSEQAKNALDLTIETLGHLGLECSPEKTKISTLKDGFQFLGFDISSQKVTIRQKSRKKFEDKIAEITTRSRNLDAQVIEKLNQVIRGTVNYFYTSFSKVLSYFKRIDNWIRERIRWMKYKSKRWTHHIHLKNKHIRRRGLKGCAEVCVHAKSKWCSLRGKQTGVAQ